MYKRNIHFRGKGYFIGKNGCSFDDIAWKNFEEEGYIPNQYFLLFY